MAEEEARTQLRAGVELNETYRLCDLIGRGGMGTVWRARHLRLPKDVAIKVLHDVVTGSDGYARFRREAEIASQLGHPHIIEALDFNTLPDGSPYLVLEHLRGQNLRQRLKQGPFSLEQAVHVTRQMASALHAAHASGVVHRDLKPENVFLCQVEGEQLPHVKILDFGISRILSAHTSLTQEGTIFGTPQYMAPEQAQGLPAEAAADQYAVGVMVYEMLAARPAYEGTTPVQVLYQVVHEPVTPLTTLVHGLPEGVYTTLARAMCKDPAQRFPDVSTFAQELARTAGCQLPTLSPASLVTAPPAGDIAMLETAASEPALQATAASEPALQGAAPRSPATEATGPIISETGAAPPRSRAGLWPVAALLAAVVAGGGVYWATRPSRRSIHRTVRVIKRPTASMPADAATPDSAPHDRGVPDLAPPPDVQAAATKKPPPARRLPPRRRSLAEEPGLSVAQRADVRRAEALLAAGRSAEEARSIGERLERQLPGPLRWIAWIIRTKAHCQLQEFGKAKGTARSIPRHLRGAVDGFCRRYLGDWR